jgi:O-acetyl-ADP-ribose deacetylase
VRHGIEKVAFPAIATGIYGYPLDRAAEIAVDEVRRHLKKHELPRGVTFVCFSEEALQAYERRMA